LLFKFNYYGTLTNAAFLLRDSNASVTYCKCTAATYMYNNSVCKCDLMQINDSQEDIGISERCTDETHYFQTDNQGKCICL